MIDSTMRGRLPTPRAELYRWHNEAVTGARVAVCEGDPHCGWFLRYNGRKNDRNAKPPEPVEIFMDQPTDDSGQLTAPERMVAIVSGRVVSAVDIWTWVAKNPIPRAEYMKMVAQRMDDF